MDKVEKKNDQAMSQYTNSQCRMCHRTILIHKDADPLTQTCSDHCHEQYLEYHSEKHWN